MIEEISGQISRDIARAFGETSGRSVSRILADGFGTDVGTIHLAMLIAGILVIFNKSK